MTQKKRYDSTVARIAGNLLSGAQSRPLLNGALDGYDQKDVTWAVAKARAIVAETERTEAEDHA